MREFINLNDMLKWNSTILDDYTLPGEVIITPDNPDEPTYRITLNHDLMSSNIIIRCGELHPLYPEPDVFKSVLNTWFVTHKWNIEHLMRLACQDYNPLENYDRREHLNVTDKDTGTDTEIHSGADVDRLGGTDTERQTGTDTTENTTSAMNSSTYQPADKSTLTYGKVTTDEYGKTDTLTHGENIATNYGKTHTNTANNHLHGNIGVTTYTQMFEQEISLVNTFNIYDAIVSLIQNDLFLSVY